LNPFRDLFERSSVAMSLLGRDRTLLDVNEAMARLFETDRDELIGMNYMDFIPEEDHPGAYATWEALNEAGQWLGHRRALTTTGAVIEMNYSIVTVDVPGHGPAFLIVTLAAHGEEDDPPAPQPKDSLTPREREVVTLVALGHTGAEIAGQLGLSPETVRSHVRNAMAKTGSHTRAQLVAVAAARRLIDAQ
jgi:PAS domain S-box-containing protein